MMIHDHSLLLCSPSGVEHQGHPDLIQDTIAILSRSRPSTIAMRGVRILHLPSQAEDNRSSSEAVTRDGASSVSPGEGRCEIDIRKLVRAVCGQESSVAARVQAGWSEPSSCFTIQGLGRSTDELLGNVLGPHSRFEIHDALEDILFLAQSCGPSYR
ncbi:hypothetical protein BJY00DRAFT_288739 [Aspergillus carlsbadensis]|nr:hypothetical protein BJY00DRAFT_288739 [Aspergillus carlsbadensis]